MSKILRRVTSKDGKRWAYSRAYKSKPGRRAGIGWTLKTRDVDGTVMVLAKRMDEATARQWVNS